MPSRNVKKRNWAFIVYQIQHPLIGKKILRQTGLQCAVSPLHDSDLDPTGEPKKPHYHVIACYSAQLLTTL